MHEMSSWEHAHLTQSMRKREPLGTVPKATTLLEQDHKLFRWSLYTGNRPGVKKSSIALVGLECHKSWACVLQVWSEHVYSSLRGMVIPPAWIGFRVMAIQLLYKCLYVYIYIHQARITLYSANGEMAIPLRRKKKMTMTQMLPVFRRSAHTQTP